MKYSISIILFCAYLISFSVYGQQNDTQLLKSKIENLTKNNQIDSVNTILNNTTTLEPEYVYDVLMRILEKSRLNKNQYEKARTHLILGNFWHKQGNKLKAFENYLQTESISRKINNKKLLAVCLMNKSTLVNDKQEKIKTLIEAAKIFEFQKDSLNLIKSYLNIGSSYGQLYEENNDSIYTPKEIEEFKNSSLEYYKKTEYVNKFFKNVELQGGIYLNYGEWFKYEKDYQKAIQSFTKAKETLAQTKNTKAYTYCIFMLAQIASEQNKFSEAIYLLEESEKLSGKYKFNDYLAMIYDEYAKVYIAKGDYINAIHYKDLYSEKSIELTEQNNNDKMQILDLEKNIAENKMQLSQYEANSKVNRIFIVASLLIAVFIGGISYLIIKNNKRKINNIEQNKIISELEKSAVEIKLKNQLLEDELLKEKIKYSQNKLMTYASRVNKIDTFIEELKTEMKPNLNTLEKREKLNALKISFSEILSNQNELQQINTLSSELNQDFFFYVRQNYPSITQEDEQLLSYLILKLGNKEISEKLNISVNSLYTKRYRLRKKLNLNENEKLLDFYKKILDDLVV